MRARPRRGRQAALLGTTLAALVTGGPGGAADLPRPDEAADYLAPERMVDARPRWTVVHREEAALVGDSFVWPEVTIGGLFDSNPFHLHRPPSGAGGADISPRILVEHDSALHRTEAYGFGDLRAFPDAAGADAVEGRAGVLHDWLVRPDVTVRLQGELDRRTDPLDTAPLLGAEAHRGLIFETDAFAAGSLQKTFERAFVVLSGTALRATFASPAGPGSVQRDLSDETIGTARLRFGYLFPSSLYVFAEPAANRRALDHSAGPSTGERGVAGVGIGRFGLLDGEVFAGYERQSYVSPSATAAMPVLGGRVGWSPRPTWTVAAQFDEELGQVAVATQADALGTPTRTETGLASIAYALSPLWRGQVDAGAAWIDYQGTTRTDRLAFADLRIDYALSRSFDLTGLLRVSDLRSSLAAASYQRAAATLAATYHY